VWRKFPTLRISAAQLTKFRHEALSMKNYCVSTLSHIHIHILTLSPTLPVDLRAAEMKTVDDFRSTAAKANAVLTIPDWEQTPEAIDAAMKDAISKANAALDQVGAQDLSKVSLKSTIVALDDLTYEASIAANKATIIKETNTSETMRNAAENAVKLFQDWGRRH
jgi:hypothetical protein